MTLRGKHSLMLAAVVAIAATSTARAEDVTVKQEDGSDWTISITPGPVANPAVGEGKAAQYRSVYNSIPFSRAEYDANPSYQHDTTMELLFDQLRPGSKVNVQQKSDVDVSTKMPYYPMYRGYNPWFGFYQDWGFRSVRIPQVP